MPPGAGVLESAGRSWRRQFWRKSRLAERQGRATVTSFYHHCSQRGLRSPSRCHQAWVDTSGRFSRQPGLSKVGTEGSWSHPPGQPGAEGNYARVSLSLLAQRLVESLVPSLEPGPRAASSGGGLRGTGLESGGGGLVKLHSCLSPEPPFFSRSTAGASRGAVVAERLEQPPERGWRGRVQGRPLQEPSHSV